MWTVAWPMYESGGQLAGFASKTFARQAFWRVVRREESDCWGCIYWGWENGPGLLRWEEQSFFE